MTVQVSPAMLAGINQPGQGRQVSPEAADIIARIRDHYRGLGKASAAHNYSRHLKSFFAWAEGAGYSIRNLPMDAVESFLATLGAAGQKETTLYVMRTQLKSALREIHNVLGVDMSHLEYQTGKPPEVRKNQKAKEKKQRAEKRLVQTAAQLQAIQAAQASLFAIPQPAAASNGQLAGLPDDSTAFPSSEYPMSDQSVPQPASQTANGAAQSQNPVVVVQMPAQNTRPTASIMSSGNQQAMGARTMQPKVGLAINTLMFTGPYIKISYISDGSNPLSPPGTEIALQLLPTSQVAPHGDLATYLQQFVIPKMRLGPLTSQIQFVFHELNEKRQPTGRKDEMVVSVPLSGAMMDQSQVQMAMQPQQIQPMGGQPSILPFGMPAPAGGMDETTRFLLTKLDREAEEAKKHAAEVQDQMRKASDTTSMMMLMQQFQRAEDARREAENRRDQETMRAMQQSQLALAPPPMPAPMPLPMPTILPPEPQQNAAAEFAKALAESQKNMMELMIASMNRPQPVPPPPPVQKDVSEWLVPFMAQMNQQAMQTQQANQQLLVGVMQSMMNREDPMLKILVQQMQEVKAAAAAPKADEMESFADKLQKMRMVSDMLGGNSGPNVLSELLANADTIGAGAAKVIAAAKAGKEPQIQQLPMRQSVNGAPQLPASTTTQVSQAQQSNEQPVAAPPAEALAFLQSVVDGVNNDDDQAIVNNVIELIKALLNAPEPYPVIGRRMLVTLKSADDSADLMILVKNLWTQLGQQVDRPAAKAVTKTLAKWYSVIHQQVFGEPRGLPENEDEQPGQAEPAEQDEQDEQDQQDEQDGSEEEFDQAAGA